MAPSSLSMLSVSIWCIAITCTAANRALNIHASDLELDEPQYKLNAAGVPCPTGTVITSASQCATAAFAVGKGDQTPDGSGYPDGTAYPYGCFMFGTEVSFNSNPKVKPSMGKSSEPICFASPQETPEAKADPAASTGPWEYNHGQLGYIKECTGHKFQLSTTNFALCLACLNHGELAPKYRHHPKAEEFKARCRPQGQVPSTSAKEGGDSTPPQGSDNTPVVEEEDEEEDEMSGAEMYKKYAQGAGGGGRNPGGSEDDAPEAKADPAASTGPWMYHHGTLGDIKECVGHKFQISTTNLGLCLECLKTGKLAPKYRHHPRAAEYKARCRLQSEKKVE